MKGRLIKINPDNPQDKKIEEVVQVLKKGGVIIYPTDTVYGIGCNIFNSAAVQKVCRIRNLDPHKMNLSFICYDLSNISEYASKVPNEAFKVMRKALPGPFTFLLAAGRNVPKILSTKKRTVGIRVPNHNIPRLLVKELGNPIITASLKDDYDEALEYLTDPELIYEKFGHLVDVVIDGGPGGVTPSTIVDFTDDYVQIIREGLGNINEFL